MIESRVPSRSRSPRFPRSTKPARRRSAAAAASGDSPARASVRVEGEAPLAAPSAAVNETTAVAHGEARATDLFGEVPAGGQEAQAAEHEAAAEPVAQDARQGSFDGFDLPADAAAEVHRAAPGSAPAAAATGDALAQAIASTDAVAEAAVREAEPAVDVTEVVAAVQEAVAGLAASDGVVAADTAATPPPAKTGAAKRGASRRAEPGVAKRKTAPAEPVAAADVSDAVLAPAIEEAARKPAPVARPIPAPAIDAAPVQADATPAIDLDARLLPLSERLRALQLETVDLRRAADREMRRVNRLMLALAAVVLIAIVALGLQTAALSSAHRDADELQRHVDRLASLQETQQANLAAMQQRTDELGMQVQRLTNRSAASPRPPAARRERRTR